MDYLEKIIGDSAEHHKKDSRSTLLLWNFRHWRILDVQEIQATKKAQEGNMLEGRWSNNCKRNGWIYWCRFFLYFCPLFLYVSIENVLFVGWKIVQEQLHDRLHEEKQLREQARWN